MGAFRDHLADLVRETVIDGGATRADWAQVLGEVFGATASSPAFNDRESLVQFEIDVDDAESPAEAALRVWQQQFRRGMTQPTADEACFFVVVDADGQHEIDLSDQVYASLFDKD